VGYYWEDCGVAWAAGLLGRYGVHKVEKATDSEKLMYGECMTFIM
jgi:hypothetical protein